MESLHKMFLAMVALIAKVLTLMSYNVISRNNYLQINERNATILCLFHASKGTLTDFSYHWIYLIFFLPYQ